MLLHSIANKLKATEFFFNNIYQSTLGFFKIVIQSKYKISLPKAKQNECIILGNGPSLKESFEKIDAAVFNKTPLVCVNNFAGTEQFFQYKPSYYVLLDPGFFIYKQRPDVVNTMNTLKEKVDWEINLFVPYVHRKDPDMQFFIKKSSFIKVRFFNYTVAKGFNFFTFKLFKKNLAMPQFYNVLGAATFLSINMGYKKIWLMGADHSWFNNIYVNDLNILCMDDKHFYDKEKEKKELVEIKDPATDKKIRVGDFFQGLVKIFNSYYLLEEYSQYHKSKIYNASEYSYLDAFERKKVEL